MSLVAVGSDCFSLFGERMDTALSWWVRRHMYLLGEVEEGVTERLTGRLCAKTRVHAGIYILDTYSAPRTASS